MLQNPKAGSVRFAGILTSIHQIGWVSVGILCPNAQGATATIPGAAIPEAAVQVKNVGTGFTQSTISDFVGRFNIPDLGIGDCEMQASKPGFSTLVHKGITLTVGSQSVVYFNHPQLGQPNIFLFTQGPNGGGSLNPQVGRITTLAGNNAARQIQFSLTFLL